jgi:hypothetical protein
LTGDIASQPHFSVNIINVPAEVEAIFEFLAIDCISCPMVFSEDKL